MGLPTSTNPAKVAGRRPVRFGANVVWRGSLFGFVSVDTQDREACTGVADVLSRSGTEWPLTAAIPEQHAAARNPCLAPNPTLWDDRVCTSSTGRSVSDLGDVVSPARSLRLSSVGWCRSRAGGWGWGSPRRAEHPI
jgi:hypothetical protein